VVELLFNFTQVNKNDEGEAQVVELLFNFT
jgi:hypothetical protein